MLHNKVLLLLACCTSFALDVYDKGAYYNEADDLLRNKKTTTKATTVTSTKKARAGSLHDSFFPSLENYQVGVTPVSEETYPWIARVIHSPKYDYPYMCTAVCIDDRIYITASRCIFNLKVNLTRVFHLKNRFAVTAFVIPSNPTKQSFDDIGFIVVSAPGFSGIWNTVQLFHEVNRTDGEFQWFGDLDISKGVIQHKAIGYAVQKFFHRIKNPMMEYSLGELDVVIGFKMCAEIFTLKMIKGFQVPCYHSCTLEEHNSGDSKCKKYLGVEGGAIINADTKKLLGIATWGTSFYKFELPVGFSIPNSENFYEDFRLFARLMTRGTRSYTTEEIMQYCECLPVWRCLFRACRGLCVQRLVFASLENYQVGATAATETNYPWIARVVHSRSEDYPYMCTAVCIDERIFITASRCIFNLKVNMTRVAYLKFHFNVIAFVIPSKPSKQAFDDIGLIVVNAPHFTRAWATIELFNEPFKRTDTEFQWFEDLNLSKGPGRHRVVGYAVEKLVFRLKTASTKYHLGTLDVVVGRNMCAEIYTLNTMRAFNVPCYHSCSLQEHKKSHVKCKNYLGVEGAAVFNTQTNRLLGIATWGAYFYKFELPVGFAIPNSDNFYEDYSCARKIRRDPSITTLVGYYQSLCDTKRRDDRYYYYNE